VITREYTLTDVHTDDLDTDLRALTLGSCAYEGLSTCDACVMIHLTQEPDATDAHAVDTAVAAHNSLIGYARDRISELGSDLMDYLCECWYGDEQRAIVHLFALSMETGKTNRKEHLRAAMDWVEACEEHWVAKADEVKSCTTREAMEAVQLDRASMDMIKPTSMPTLYSAMKITD